MPKASTIWIIIYHLHYPEKFQITKSVYNLCLLCSNKPVSNSTWTSVFATSFLCFEYSLGHMGNFLKTSLFANNGRVFIIKPGLVIKKKKSPKTFLDLLFDALQSLFLFLSLAFLKLRPAIMKYYLMFMYLVMSKCVVIIKC